MTGEWLTVADVAEALGIPARDVRALIFTGELEAERCPSAICSYHVTEKSVEAYIAQRLPAGTP